MRLYRQHVIMHCQVHLKYPRDFPGDTAPPIHKLSWTVQIQLGRICTKNQGCIQFGHRLQQVGHKLTLLKAQQSENCGASSVFSSTLTHLLPQQRLWKEYSLLRLVAVACVHSAYVYYR